MHGLSATAELVFVCCKIIRSRYTDKDLYFQCDVNLITLLIFEDIKLRCLLYVHKGGIAVEIKTEADSNDMTECSHDDMPLSLFVDILIVTTCVFVVRVLVV